MKLWQSFHIVMGAAATITLLSGFYLMRPSSSSLSHDSTPSDKVLLWTHSRVNCTYEARCIGQFNNQYIVAYFSLQLARILNRRIHYFDIDLRVKPKDPPQILPFEGVFNTSEPEIERWFVRKPSLEEVSNTYKNISFRELFFSQEERVVVEIDSVAWFYMYHQLGLCTIVECLELPELINHFLFVDDILQYVENWQRKYPELSSSIGVHLRAGDQKRACRKIKNPILVNFFTCYHNEFKDIINQIERIRKNQSVYVSTNDQGFIIGNLTSFYANKFIPQPNTQSNYQPVVEALLLDRTHHLLANFHSTFSTNSILRRNYQNYSYFKVYILNTSIPVSSVAYALPFILYFSLFAVLKFFTKKARLAAFTIELGIFMALYFWFRILPFSFTFKIYWTVVEPFICLFSKFCKTSPIVVLSLQIITFVVIVSLLIQITRFLRNKKITT